MMNNSELREKVNELLWDIALNDEGDEKAIDKVVVLVQAQQLKLLDEIIGALPEKRTIGDYNDGGDYNYRNRRDAVDSAYNEPINRVQAKLATIKERIEHG